MKPTPGPWKVRVRNDSSGDILDCFVSASDVNGFHYDAEIMGDDEYRDDMERKKSDCDLIADAGTTYHATGLTPSELAAQRDELLAALQHAEEILYELGAESETVKSAITNATKGEK